VVGVEIPVGHQRAALRRHAPCAAATGKAGVKALLLTLGPTTFSSLLVVAGGAWIRLIAALAT
jgi:hypothetical protein